MHLTPYEQKIIDLLADGLPHDRQEVLACLKNTAADLNHLAMAILRLRPKIRAMGHEIVTELRRGGIHYRHVILLSGKDPLSDDPM